MFDRDLLNPMLTGSELYNALQVIPKYDDSIRKMDKSVRLIALSDLYSIYLPSKMSEEIYAKLYLSLIRSLNKKATINAIKQSNENYKSIRGMSYQGVIGGADSYTIIGCSGIGKSTAISRAVSLISNKSFIELNGTKICPIIVAQCPFDSSIKGLMLEVLRIIDSILETKYYTNALRSHATTDVLIGMVSQVSLNHVGLLIIDEIQHCAISKNGRLFINGITQLINTSGISICMIGTPECTEFFKNKLQLARRSMGLSYTPLTCDAYFQKLCRVIFDYQYTRQKAELTDTIMEWLYEHSAGIVSLVITLIHDAQEIAILNGTEQIELSTLNEAYEKRSSMLHSYISSGIKKLPQTGVMTKQKKHPILERISAQNTGGYIIQDLSICEIVEQSKRNGFNVVGALKQYCKIEEIANGEIIQ